MSLATGNVQSRISLFTNSAFALIWLIVALVVYYTTNGSTMMCHNIMTWLATVSYIMAIVCWLKRGNRIFSIYLIFVIYALFSNLGHSLLMSFGLEPIGSGVYENYSLSAICRMLKFQYVCAAAFYSGTCWYLRYSYRSVSAKECSNFYEHIVKRNSNPAGLELILEIFLFVCLAVVLYFTLYQLRMRQTMSYHELYNSRELISGLFVFGSIVLGLYSIFRKRHVRLIIICWAWYILAYFMAGTRSMAIVYFGAMVFSLPIIKPEWFKQNTYFIWIILALIAIASLNIISTMRQVSLGGKMDFFSVGGFDIALFNSINEMGASEYPSIITIEKINQGFPHCQTILYHLLLGFIPAPILQVFVPENWTIQLGKWATDAVYSYSELGYSWIAESYMNFGSFGWIFTFIYGWFVAMAENYSLRRMQNGQYVLAICLISLLCRQIFFARGQIALSLPFYRYSIYGIIIYSLFFSRNNNHKHIKI